MKGLKLLKYIMFGISWGCLFFVITCLIGNAVAGEDYLLLVMKDFNRQALGAMLVGMGYGTTSIVYNSERLPFGLQVFIHFAVGTAIYFPTAITLGWMPMGSPINLVSMIILSILAFFIIWSMFYFYYRAEAKKINRQLKQLEKDSGKQ